jgi:site-specific recombinase XerD
MTAAQLPLFQRKTFTSVIAAQKLPVAPPSNNKSVLSTLSAYYAYLQSGGYSKYTPDDFTGDVKKFGLYLRDKPISEITVHDVRDFVSTLKSKEKLSEKTVSRKLFHLAATGRS